MTARRPGRPTDDTTTDGHALLLWDLDGTLVDLDGLNVDILATAFQQIAGRPPDALPELHGRTDKAILLEVLSMHSISATRLGDLYEAMTRTARTLRRHMMEVGRAMPGALDALAVLASTGAVQSVVTGNLPGVARTKLGAFGLATNLDLEVGAYGNEATDRTVLVQLAVGRAQRVHRVLFAEVIVIGDTIHDIHGARRAGARSIGVATGHHTAEDLHVAGADHVLENLTDTAVLTSMVAGQGIPWSRR